MKLAGGTTPTWVTGLWVESHHNGKGQAEATEITTPRNLRIKSSIILGGLVSATLKDLTVLYHISV